ncbi:MAG: thiamine pyrophosphate-dependent enzyme [Candidatus Thalassarchaeaceae archaeon]|jgi:pyruvate/2-oxoacid:ferredoxin oxidoreductase beta subunit/Pyruvate/2-oxoacid:ferredoxin oxidoreductase delta subunit|nr:thiamine pyrophosphate-binding protein [Euryarchaeota archaeon]MDP6220035.1 thiamine pyrophosphate-dependent enzyme [Candidatus Thalassarchaeaceae archaeon]MDP7091197.1 thiamine pyrophosphate-dependent enzyme [Candidatus Thalassarchaeaceae archaeon]MDP7257116.1 thiamine pyrophosphate-dependent enzyme [Candidatus Thalassarchaeaceae archaeon]MDP7445687.1 thiamine pyrophosphate-dependent enzyme [Candidatus Thalassarchaeaceae archaeon]|tara:strand:+ start:12540 stop:14162 length:1623 start_codon:yes stop_codon:yes gene_type:complete
MTLGDPNPARKQTAHDKEFFDLEDFEQRIISAYNQGHAASSLPADVVHARSLIGPASGRFRDFSYIATEIPEFIAENCVGCMDCVTMCPDTAILGKVVREEALEEALLGMDKSDADGMRAMWPRVNKYWKNRKRKGEEPGRFGIFIDPSKCKGCAECVDVCGSKDALAMVSKEKKGDEAHRREWEFYIGMGETEQQFVNERSPMDIMLRKEALLYVGGAGSCAGCGEATALRMMAAATGYDYGADSFAVVNSTGCSTVYGSTYPYNPWAVPWTNSLFENGPTDAMGVRARWDQIGWDDKRLWVVGGDGALYDIGFGALSRMLASGMDIKVLVLDTQVYSNTGGQTSTATFTGQSSKMYPHGSVIAGKQEFRKELGAIAAMHPNTYVAQTVTSLPNHFYRAIRGANEFKGPAVVSVYTTCQPEHGVADDASYERANLALKTRTWPIFIHDPRKGPRFQDRWDLRGNPSPNKDWHSLRHDDGSRRELRFRDFAIGEGRFSKQFDTDGTPSETILIAEQDRLAFWNRLQDMSGIERIIESSDD